MADCKYRGGLGQSRVLGSQGIPRISSASEAANAFTLAADGSLAAHAVAGGLNQRPDLSMGYRLAEAYPSQAAVLATHGLGGSSIEALSKGGSTGAYEELVSRHDTGVTAAGVRGDTWETISVHFIGGERDQGSANTPLDTYVDRTATLHADLIADLDAPDLILVQSQMATNGYYGNEARISLAQLKAARTLPNVFIVGGEYQLEYDDDKIHLTATGYYHLGELHARAEIGALGTGWAPFAPTSVTVDPAGTTITAVFDVPVEPLVFDTTIVAAQTDMGFSLHGTTASIVNVDITDADTVTITVDGPLQAGAQLGYAVAYNDGGPSFGNLRDSETAVSDYDAAPLPNWALQFRDPIEGITTPPPSVAYRVDQAYLIGAFGERYPISVV